MEEVNQLGALEGADIRKAKEVLAFEATKITHGQDEALKAQQASRNLFNSADNNAAGVPSSKIQKEEFERGIGVLELFERVGLVSSKSEARRLIKQGGCYINNNRVADISFKLKIDTFTKDTIILRAGKKKYHRIFIE